MMEETKKCPYCGKEIMATAKKCRFCGEWLDKDTASANVEQSDSVHEQVPPFRGDNARTSYRQEYTGDVEEEQKKYKMFSQPFSFEGRINRKEYILTYVIVPLAMLIMGGLANLIDPISDHIGIGADIIFGIIFGVPFVAAIWIFIAAEVKRCHDCGFSGWYQLVLPFFSLMFLPRNKYSNDYGDFIDY